MNAFKSIGGLLLAIVIVLGSIIGLILVLIFGSAVAFSIAPVIIVIAAILLVLDVILLFFAFSRSLRPVIGMLLYGSSYLFGLVTWIYGLAVTLSLWGIVAVIIGIILGGIGVVPIGLLAALVQGHPGIFWTLLGSLILTYLARVGGALLAGSGRAPSSTSGTHHRASDEVIDLESDRLWGDDQ